MFRRAGGSTLSNGVFEVPNTRMKTPPARVSFRVDGSVPAAAELLALDRLREFSGAPFDPAGTRGNAQRPGPTRHAAAARPAAGLDRLRHHRRSCEFQRRQDAVRPEGRGADAAGHGQQPASTRSRATSRSRARRRRSNTASSRANPTPRCRLQATLDEAARARLGLDVGPALAGAMPMQAHRPCRQRRAGRPLQRRSRSDRDQDRQSAAGLGQAAGRPARLAFTLVKREERRLRFDDLLIDGQGVLAKGVGRARQQRRPAVGELSGVRDLRRRQGVGARPTAAPTARCGW